MAALEPGTGWKPAPQRPSAASPAQLDFGDAIIVPGFVNPHTHLQLGPYAELPPQPFWSWLPELVARRAQPGALEAEAEATVAWAWRSLRQGVTCVGDISHGGRAWRALKGVPIRKVCFVELLTLAAQQPRDPAELIAALDAVEEDDLLMAGVSPHAPYTVALEHARAAIALAAARQRPWTTHLAETREEIAFLAGDGRQMPEMLRVAQERQGLLAPSPGLTPVEYLRQIRGSAPPGSFAHGNYLSDAEFARLAESGDTVLFCPGAHRYFGHSPHPLPRLLAAGVRVALGTDSPASNEGFHLLGEARLVRRDLGAAAPSSARLLEMITRTAAEAIGLGERMGCLTAGRLADLAVFPCRSDSTDPIGELIDDCPAPLGVWVAGRRVVGDDRVDPAARSC